jgi:hypothetical protein
LCYTKEGADSYLKDCERKQVTILGIEKYVQVSMENDDAPVI